MFWLQVINFSPFCTFPNAQNNITAYPFNVSGGILSYYKITGDEFKNDVVLPSFIRKNLTMTHSKRRLFQTTATQIVIATVVVEQRKSMMDAA